MEIATIYNPHQQTEQELLDGFVIREKEFKTIFNDIQKNKMQTPPQHYIVYGVRGNGKTSLLLKLFYEVRRDADLDKWLIPVIFKEEQYNLRTLYKLWEHVAEYLDDDFSEFSGLISKMEQNEESDNYEEKCFELLQSSLESNGKKLVLFFDNFGVFLNKLTDREHQRLREVLITCSDIRIIGTSTFVDEVTYDYGKPFFDFFKPVYLKELNREDTIKLLLKLNEKSTSGDINKIIEQNPGRIEALRRLTSGIPRTIVLLFQIFVDNSNGNSFKDLDLLLDKVTPLYKSRMDDLPAQQQEIADIIAKNWDAITVKEIVKKSRIPSNAVSAQLKQLEKNRLIIKKGTSTKNNMYQVAERFFNIWYLMRNARNKDKCKVRWLVNFLEIWCDRNELTVRAKSHIEALKAGKLNDKYAFHMSEAYAQIVDSSAFQHEILVSTRKYLKSINSDLVNDLSTSDIEIEKIAVKFWIEGNLELALTNFLKIERRSGTTDSLIGSIYFKLKDFNKAEEFYLMASKKGEVVALALLGMRYLNDKKDLGKAEKYFQMGVEKGEYNAMFQLGNLYYSEYKDFEKAKEYYMMSVEKGNSFALLFLGNLYCDIYKEYEKAEEYYREAMKFWKYDAMHSMAWMYFELKKNKTEALNYSRQAFEKEKNIYLSHTYSCILLWHNEIEKAIEVSKEFMNNENSYSKFGEDIKLILLLLLAKKQYHFVFNFFQENKFDIQDRYKPIYYALMSLLQNEYPDEIKRMGSELEETVKEILEKIEQLAKDYE